MFSELFADGGRRQKGGAAHSANEQEGKEGKVSILTLADFKFGF